MSFNKIIVVGNLGRDPELRYTPQGTAVCDFSIATNEKRRDKSGEMQDVTTWFKVTTWNKQAEVASKYLSKGKSVYIEGRLRLEEYTDREGKNRTSLEINASDIQFLSGGDNFSGGGASTANANEFSKTNDYDSEAGGSVGSSSSSSGGGGNYNAPNDDDIPF